MRAFNLEEAKAGKPLITRDGRDAKFIAYVEDAKETQKVVVMSNGNIIACSDFGRWLLDRKCNDDLFMKTVKRTIFLNAWEDRYGNGWCRFALKDDAIQHSKCCPSVDFIAIAVPIEIEE